MRKIEVSESTFSQLQELAKPLVDNAETVIIRLISNYRNNTSDTNMEPLDDSIPGDVNLTHTKILSVFVKGKQINAKRWNHVLYSVLKTLMDDEQLPEEEILSKAGVPWQRGVCNEPGYHHVPGTDVSIQNRSANHTWNYVCLLISNHECPVEVSFQWRNKETAQRPGKRGTIKAP